MSYLKVLFRLIMPLKLRTSVQSTFHNFEMYSLASNTESGHNHHYGRGLRGEAEARGVRMAYDAAALRINPPARAIWFEVRGCCTEHTLPKNMPHAKNN